MHCLVSLLHANANPSLHVQAMTRRLQKLLVPR
jgi:hypothetical protein